MALPPNGDHGEPSGEHGRKPQNKVQSDVHQRQHRPLVLQQGDRFAAECGIGCKGAEYSHHQEQSNFGGYFKLQFDKLGQCPDEQASDNIDRKGAVGKINPMRKVLNVPAYQIPENCTQKTADTDKKQIPHFVTALFSGYDRF